jgi:hypothetical protein
MGRLADALRPFVPPVVMRLAAPAKQPRIGQGEVGSGLSVSGGIPDVDYVEDLSYPEFLEAYRKMANDPAVARELRAVRFPTIAADWDVEPASDDRLDVQVAEFCAANLYQQEGDFYGRDFWCRTPWLRRLNDALRMMQNGFAVFQVVWRRQGRFIVYDKVKYLQPESITNWYFDREDNLLRIERTYQRADGSQATLEKIDAEQLFIYTWDQEGSNILGTSFIRPAWKPYTFKSKYEKFSVIDKQRTSVGVPFFKNPIDDSPENITRGEQIAKAMRGGNYERMWVRHDEGQDFGWKEGGQSTKGLPDLVRQQDEQVQKVGAAGFLGLGGEGQGGSRGVAGTQASFSGLQLTAVVKWICMYENMLIRTLVDFNWETDCYPKSKCSNIDPFEKTRSVPEFTDSLTKLMAAKADLDTINEVRRRYGFMETTEEALAEQEEEDDDDPTPDGDDPDDSEEQSPSDQAPPDKEGESVSNAARRRRKVRLEVPKHIAPAKVDPDAIRRQLMQFEASYLLNLKQVRTDMVEVVTSAIAAGDLRPKAVTDVRVPFQQDLSERLLSVAKSARDFGRDQVERELNRQLMALARRAVPNPSTRKGSIAYSNRQAEVMVNLDVSNLVARLQSEVVARYNVLAGSGASDPEIAKQIDDYLGSISDRQLESMARQSTSLGFNSGRNVAIQEYKAQLEPFAIRTEVLDDNTCDVCEAYAQRAEDGERFTIGTAEYLENMPPAGCKGQNRCRGFYAVFAKA